MNHGLRTYQWSCRSFEEEEEDDDEITVLPISIADSDGPARSSGAGILYG